MRRSVVLIALLVAACASSHGANDTPIAPLTAASSADALQQLAARRTSLPGARAFLRVHAGQQSFKAQLRVNGPRLELTAYTPLNTTAATLFADGDRVTFINNIESTYWEGSASQLGGSFGVFAAGATPTDVALLILGYPAASGTYDATPAGLARATLGGIDATYEPPSLPAQHVTLRWSTQTFEFTILDAAASSDAVTPPRIPPNYHPGGMPAA